jgi:type I restriction enzyme, S subunit
MNLTFGDLGQIFDGPHATPERKSSGPYFLNIASLRSGRLDLDESDHVSEGDFITWTRRVEPTMGDLLFSYETRLGEAALMPAGIRACLGRRMALLRPNKSRVHPRFLLYYYLSPGFQSLIKQNTIHGATVNRISLSTVGSWPVTMPDVAEQRAIAEVLGALDDKIAANAKLRLSAEGLLRAKFDALRMITNESGANRIVLNDLCDLSPKTPAPTSGEPIYLEMQRLPTQGMTIDSWEQRPARGGARFQNGDTLMARITPCLENRKTGYVDFVPPGETGLGSTEYIVMRPRPGVPTALPYFIAVNEEFRQFAIRHMVGTSGRQRVSAEDLRPFAMNAPSAEDVNKFERLSAPALQLFSSLRDESRRLTQLRDILLPLLMSGRLRARDALPTIKLESELAAAADEEQLKEAT